MKKFLSTILIGGIVFFSGPPLKAQTFSRYFSPLSEIISPNVINQTSDGGYILAGKATDASSGALSDFFIAKFNSIGDTVWTQRIGGNGADYATSVQETFEGGFIVAGSSNSFGAGNNDIVLVKTDATGNVQWSKAYGGTLSDHVYSVRQNSDSGYVISGSVIDSKMLVIRTNSSGDTLWTKRFSNDVWPTTHAQAYYAEQTPDGGFIVTGQIDSMLNYTALIVLKLDSAGNKIKSRSTFITYFTLWIDTYAKPTPDGGYVVVFKVDPENIVLHKFNAAGNPQVIKSYTFNNFFTYNIDVVSIKPLPDSTYLMFAAGEDAPKSLLVKLDALCNPVWSKYLDINGDDAVFTSDGSLAVSFSGNSSGGGIHKLDTSFNSECITSNPYSLITGLVSTPPAFGVSSAGGGITVTPIPDIDIVYAVRESRSTCITALSEIPNEKQIYLSPNPATNQCTIYGARFTIENIQIHNLLGEKVFEQPETSNPKPVTVDVSDFAPGIYFVKVQGDKTEHTVKFIKQ